MTLWYLALTFEAICILATVAVIVTAREEPANDRSTYE